MINKLIGRKIMITRSIYDQLKRQDGCAREKIKQQAEDINPKEDNIPDSLAEATTAPLEDNELGGNATQDDVKNDK